PPRPRARAAPRLPSEWRARRLPHQVARSPAGPPVRTTPECAPQYLHCSRKSKNARRTITASAEPTRRSRPARPSPRRPGPRATDRTTAAVRGRTPAARRRPPPPRRAGATRRRQPGPPRRRLDPNLDEALKERRHVVVEEP